MKKLMLFFAACVALTACKKEVLTQGTPFQKGETVTITAGASGSGGNAKVGGYDDGSSLIKFTWNEGDEIKVTVGTASSNFLLSDGAGEANAAFMGTMPASGTNFDVQYPTADPDLSTQTYVKNSVPKGKMLFTATNCTKDHIAELKMAYAILKLQFTGSQAVSKIVVETVDYSSPKSYTLNISGVTLTSTPTPFLMVVDPMTAKLKVTLYDNAATPAVITSITTSTEQTLTAGGCLKMPEKPAVAEPKGLCFTALEAGCTVAMTGAPNLEYSVDNGTTYSPWNGSTITLANGAKVYIKANSTGNTTISSQTDIKKFATTGRLKVSGNIMYLLNGTSPATATMGNKYCFSDLFNGCTIVDASELLLPTHSKPYCYKNMFLGCSSLTAAPAALPANSLSMGSCYAMFKNCTSLTTAPAMNATTVGKSSCFSMFEGCTELTTAPELPATTLVECCYKQMFKGCSKLKTVKMLATTVGSLDFDQCLNWWLREAGTSGSGTKVVYVASGLSDAAINVIQTESTGWTLITNP